MKAIVTVVGKDRVGIIAKVSAKLSELGANIEDISQTVLQDYFVMIMMVDISGAQSIAVLSKEMNVLAGQIGVDIRLQHEDIFNTMHRI